MKEVWLVYVISQNDGYDDTEVYATKEKACDAADQLVFEFKEEGFVIIDESNDFFFTENMVSDCHSIRLNKEGEVEITVEKKKVR